MEESIIEAIVIPLLVLFIIYMVSDDTDKGH
jgi:hypothetical protein